LGRPVNASSRCAGNRQCAVRFVLRTDVFLGGKSSINPGCLLLQASRDNDDNDGDGDKRGHDDDVTNMADDDVTQAADDVSGRDSRIA